MTFKIDIVGDSGKPPTCMYVHVHDLIQHMVYYAGVGKTTMLLRLVKPEFTFGGRLKALCHHNITWCIFSNGIRMEFHTHDHAPLANA